MTSPVKQTGARPKGGLPVQRHFWRHAIEMALLAGLAAFGLAALGRQLRWPPWQPIVLAGAVVCVVLVVIMVTGGHGAVHSHVAVCGIVVVGWVAAAQVVSPWTKPMIIALVLAVIVLAPAGVLAWSAREAQEARWRRPKIPGEAWQYEQALEAAGFPGVDVTRIDRTRAGKTVHLQLPSDGRVTYWGLCQATDRLEIALPGRLRSGSIRFEPAGRAREVHLIITERDVLAEVVPFPADAVERTINDPFSVGLREDGREEEILLREIAMLVIGMRSMGKSNALNVLLARLAWCVDAVVFMIDMKGGAVIRPWIEPWARGQCPRPPIDWIATDRDEAELMLTAVLNGVQFRSSTMRGSKVRPSTSMPAVILICDEVAVIFGMNRAGRLEQGATTNSQLAGLGTRFTELGRAAAMDPIWCTQRSTVSTIGGGDLKSQCGLRVGLGVASESDARSLIEDDQRAAKLLAKLLHPGSSLIWDRERPPLPVKWYRLDADTDKDAARIAQIATDTGWLQPDLDAGTAEAMGEAYANRWARPAAQQMIRDLAGPPANGEQAAWQDIIGRLGDDPEARLHPSWRRMRELVAERKHGGISPAEIFVVLKGEGRGVARETIQRWLGKDLDDGLMEKIRHGRWRIRQHQPPASGGEEPGGHGIAAQ